MIFCNDYGDRPGCLGTVDDRYTMVFNEGTIYWCAFCGPDAQMMNEALTNALETRGPEFQKELSDAIEEASRKTKLV